MAECHPSKVDVASSNLVSRSLDEGRKTEDENRDSSFVFRPSAISGSVAQG
jgi:hypothetical protein